MERNFYTQNKLKSWFFNKAQCCLVIAVIFSAYITKAQMAYITNSGSANVSVVDLATNSFVTNVTVGLSPQGVAVAPDQSKVYVTNFGSNTVALKFFIAGNVSKVLNKLSMNHLTEQLHVFTIFVWSHYQTP